MRIGIDISQIVYEGTGVSKYVRNIVQTLLSIDNKNEYVLFGASLRRRDVFTQYFQVVRKLNKRVTLIDLPIPPTILDFFWNRLHIVPVEWFIGSVDVFWSSDWTQPPLISAKGITTIHDLIILNHPEESHPCTELKLKNMIISSNIVQTQKRRLVWVKKECTAILCDSEATRQDIVNLLNIEASKLKVVYPGFN